MVNRELELGKRPGFLRKDEEPADLYQRPLSEDPTAQSYVQLYDEIWNAQSFRAIPKAYQFATTLEAPTAHRAIGHQGIDAWFMAYLSSFPDARFKAEHLIERSDPGLPQRVSMRWSVDWKKSRGKFSAKAQARACRWAAFWKACCNSRATLS